MNVEEASRGTHVKSTIKSFSRRKDGRGSFQALVSNYSGEVKHRSISKKTLNLLQNIKWNGSAYPLERHVFNHWQARDDLLEYSAHIQLAFSRSVQNSECPIDIVACVYSTLQEDAGHVRAF